MVNFLSGSSAPCLSTESGELRRDFAELVGTLVVGGDIVVGILAGQVEDPERGQRDGRLFDNPEHAAEFLLHLRTRAGDSSHSNKPTTHLPCVVKKLPLCCLP